MNGDGFQFLTQVGGTLLDGLQFLTQDLVPELSASPESPATGGVPGLQKVRLGDHRVLPPPPVPPVQQVWALPNPGQEQQLKPGPPAPPAPQTMAPREVPPREGRNSLQAFLGGP